MKTLNVVVTCLLSITVSATVAQEIEVLWLDQNVPCSWGLATAPDDSVYCVDAFDPGIANFDSDGTPVMTWSTEGIGPRGAAVDSQGRVYVADEFNSRIVRFSGSGVFDKMWGNDVLSGNGTPSSFEVCSAGENCYIGQSDPQGFTSPHDIAIDPRDDSLVIADTVAARVVRLDPISNELSVLYDTCETEGCVQVLSVAVDTNGSLFVTLDFNNVARYDYVLALDAYSRAWLRNLGTGHPPTAHYVALDSLANAYVSDEQKHRVHMYDLNGEPVMVWGWGVATGAAKLEVCTDGGLCLDGLAWGFSDPPNEGQFMGPIGIAVDSEDHILVVDNAARLQKFAIDGDEDGTRDSLDNCPTEANSAQSNIDGDSYGDICDICPGDPTNSCEPGSSAATEIDPSLGGTVASDDGDLALVIDANSISEPTTTTISATQQEPNDGPVDVQLGTGLSAGQTLVAYDFQPDGTTFDPPATLTLVFDVSAMNENQRSRLTIYQQQADGKFAPIEGASCEVIEDPSGIFTAMCTAPVSHFSVLTAIVPADSDDDGVFDDFDTIFDSCGDTAPLPEDVVPTAGDLGKNRWAIQNEDGTFVQAPPQAGSVFSFDIVETRGCTCEQIIEAVGLGRSHTKKGCSTSAILEWINNP